VNSMTATLDPVARVRSVLVDAIAIGTPCRYPDEFLRGGSPDVPIDTRQVNIAAVLEERTVVRMVVQPLLQHVVGPPKSEDPGILPKGRITEFTFATGLDYEGEVG
jgi:hypothetical protein